MLPPVLGKVVTERELRIGYLEQDPQFNDQSISDFIYSIGNSRQQLIRQYEEAVNQLVTDEKLLNKLMDDLSSENAWEYEYEIKTILGRLGIQKLEQRISNGIYEVANALVVELWILFQVADTKLPFCNNFSQPGG